MKENKIFNPSGDDNLKTIIKGNPTGLFSLANIKYTWTTPLYNLMVGNFWLPEKVGGLMDDRICFVNDLSKHEKTAYKGILSFLIFLDSIQTVNVPNISDYITAPEVNRLLAVQSYQELIHSTANYLMFMRTIDLLKI
jgi:ribonucleoside-diphosphate reductase beta chain